MSIECFAGLRETAVPLILDDRTEGFLMTGQVFTSPPEVRGLEQFFDGSGRSAEEIEALQKLHCHVPQIDKTGYRRIIDLLMEVRLQLVVFMGRLALESRAGDPDPVRIAMEVITGQIDEALALENVARQSRVSSADLTILFWQALGVSVPEFIERQRVELAKFDLLRAGIDAKHAAGRVGFHSASALSRCFEKHVGKSPAAYRARMALALFPRLTA